MPTNQLCANGERFWQTVEASTRIGFTLRERSREMRDLFRQLLAGESDLGHARPCR